MGKPTPEYPDSIPPEEVWRYVHRARTRTLPLIPDLWPVAGDIRTVYEERNQEGELYYWRRLTSAATPEGFKGLEIVSRGSFGPHHLAVCSFEGKITARGLQIGISNINAILELVLRPGLAPIRQGNQVEFEHLNSGVWVYRDDGKPTQWGFYGRETIKCDENLVYELNYTGGLFQPRVVKE